MCGIVAYTGPLQAQPVLVEGLRRLEYRGYDSAGLATLAASRLHVRKCPGRVADLEALLRDRPAPGRCGIGHTRWATHGPATRANAHPHVGGQGAVAVVHNGVIDNHRRLRRSLQISGVTFKTETDTEVIAHLIASYLADDLAAAVREAAGRLRGTYALAVLSRRHPGLVVGACRGSPLVLGIGDGQALLASDLAALRGHAWEAVCLRNFDVCLIRPGDWQVTTGASGQPIPVHLRPLGPALHEAGKGTFRHHMLKEIHEQPEVIEETLRGRLDGARGTTRLEGLGPVGEALRRARRLVLTGCGSSYHAALIGEYLFEELARLPVEVEYASEFRYRDAPLDRHTVVVALTQSGETADTLAAVNEARRKGYPTLALCNVEDSSIAREADAVLPLRAGPEVGVASTKAFTAQLALLALLALSAGRARGLSRRQGLRVLEDLRSLPGALRRALGCEAAVVDAARRHTCARHFLYLGRGNLYPLAREGALKLKEVAYLPAEGFPAAEMKHGPLALVDDQTPSVFLVARGGLYDKLLANLEEVKARGGPVIAVAGAGDTEVAGRGDLVIPVPEVPDYLQPLVAAVPLQLLAYHVALLRGCDVDRPRHLAKSVTVE
jgi:glucosamine--fructose-6-phosphate aminotransferase (isomerizing)